MSLTILVVLLRSDVYIPESSLLQGIIGEMRRSSGTVTFSGRVAYCPQGAWIQVGSERLPLWLADVCRMQAFEIMSFLANRSMRRSTGELLMKLA